MKCKIIAVMILLCVGIICSNSLMANEGLAKPIEIQLYRHVIGQAYQRFLSDYSRYQLKPAIDCWNVYECNNRWYIFNTSNIDENDFLEMIRNDSRVYSALFDPAPIKWRPRALSIRLSDETDEMNFINSYSEFKLRGSINGSTPYYDEDRNVFTFDDTYIYPGDFLDMLRSDVQVLAVNFVYGWLFGRINILLNDWALNDETLDKFLEDYSYFEMTMLNEPPTSSNYFWAFQFDFISHDEFLLYKELNSDERILGAGVVFYEFIDYCGGSSTNDDPIIAIEKVSVWPNPARNEEVTFKLSSVVGDTSYSPHIHGGGKGGDLNISIYNVRGQLIKKSNDFQTRDGENIFVWNKRNENNQEVASGVYFYRIYAPQTNTADSMNASVLTGRFLILK